MNTAQGTADATGTEDDYEAAFYEFAGVKPPEEEGEGGDTEADEGAVEPEAPAEAPKPDDGQAATPAASGALTDDDLLKLVPAEQAGAVRARLAADADALHRLSSERGRQAALQRLLAEQRAEADRLRAELADATTAVQQREAQAAVAAAADAQARTKDKISEEFPELSDPINIRIREEVQKLMPPPPGQPAARSAPAAAPSPASQAEAEDPNVRYAAEYTELSRAYPNWMADRQSPSYEDWIALQPAGVKALGDSEHVEDAKFLLRQFYQAKAEADVKVRDTAGKREQLREHVAPRRNPGPRTEGGSATDSFESHFDGFAAQRARRG